MVEINLCGTRFLRLVHVCLDQGILKDTISNTLTWKMDNKKYDFSLVYNVVNFWENYLGKKKVTCYGQPSVYLLNSVPKYKV